MDNRNTLVIVIIVSSQYLIRGIHGIAMGEEANPTREFLAIEDVGKKRIIRHV